MNTYPLFEFKTQPKSNAANQQIENLKQQKDALRKQIEMINDKINSIKIQKLQLKSINN